MRRPFWWWALLLFGLLGWISPLLTFAPVHAQATSPSYVCPFGNGGTANTSPCTQYIVEVSTARIGGGVFIYQVTDNPVDVSTLNEVTAAAGTISGTSVQEPLPNNGGGTFTLAVTQP